MIKKNILKASRDRRYGVYSETEIRKTGDTGNNTSQKIVEQNLERAERKRKKSPYKLELLCRENALPKSKQKKDISNK